MVETRLQRRQRLVNQRGRTAAQAARIHGRTMGMARRSTARRVVDAGMNLFAPPLVNRGYQAAMAVRDMIRRRRSARAAATQTGTGARYHTTGKFGGKFKKPGKVSNTLAVYGNKGIQKTYEIHGTINDPDCVYISHAAIDGYELITTSVRALIRKLFEKANFRITNADELLTSTSIITAIDWQVQLTQLNGKTGVETVLQTHDLVATSTVNTVSAVFQGAMLTYSAGYGNTGAGNASVDTTNPFRIILFRQDFNTTRGLVFEAEIRLDEEILCVVGASEMKVQNRTLAANNSTDAEDVNNNPLIGKIYQFSGMPKLRDKTAFPLATIPVDRGVQLVRAASITNTAYKEPPVPNVFSNIKKMSKIRLEPGEVKTIKISHKKHMSFLTFLRAIRLQYGTGPEFNGYYTIFPTQILALEDLINVNSTQKISVAYECNKTMGIYLKTKTKATAMVAYQNVEFNNFVA